MLTSPPRASRVTLTCIVHAAAPWTESRRRVAFMVTRSVADAAAAHAAYLEQYDPFQGRARARF